MKRFVMAALLLVMPCLATAQAPARQTPVIPGVSGGFFGVSVPDLEASAKWYSETLGLTRVLSGARSGKVAGVVVLEGGGLVVELIQHDESAKPASAELVQGFFKAGVVVSDFDAAVAALRAKGIPIVMGPYPARETRRANVAFRDNAGNLIFLVGGYATGRP